MKIKKTLLKISESNSVNRSHANAMVFFWVTQTPHVGSKKWNKLLILLIKEEMDRATAIRDFTTPVIKSFLCMIFPGIFETTEMDNTTCGNNLNQMQCGFQQAYLCNHTISMVLMFTNRRHIFEVCFFPHSCESCMVLFLHHIFQVREILKFVLCT